MKVVHNIMSKIEEVKKEKEEFDPKKCLTLPYLKGKDKKNMHRSLNIKVIFKYNNNIKKQLMNMKSRQNKEMLQW